MARRFLRNLPRRLLLVVGALLVLGVLLFFGLTRTEVGRSQLKEQIEAQFDERFAGDLQIGRLTGNLIGTVYARDVRVLDPEDRAVLAVDSVRATPRWRSLLGGQVRFSEVELMGPRAALVRSPSSNRMGGWNVAHAFRQTAPRDTSGGEPFALTFADVVVRGGQLRTENRGSAPLLVRRGWLFDFTNAQLADVNARLSFKRTADGGLQIDLRRLRAQLAGKGLPLKATRSQLTISEKRLALRPGQLELGQTRLTGSFSMSRIESAGPPVLRVDLEKSRLDHDEIRRLVPRWPLRGSTAAALEARGPLDDLTIGTLRLGHGASTLRADGTAQGLPESLRFDVQFEESRLAAADLRAVLPGLPPEALNRLARFGTARFSLRAEGRLANLSDGVPVLRASTRFDVHTDAGALQGTAEVARSGRDQPLTYNAEVRADDFEAGHLTDAALPSRLTGTVTLRGEGVSSEALAGQLEAELASSTVAGHTLDGFDVNLRAAGENRLEGTATLRQRGGSLRLEGTVDRSGALPAYDLTARGEGFDLGALLGRDSLRTALTGTAQFDGHGASLRTLVGRLRLALDSSTVTRGGTERVLAPLASTLTLSDDEDEGPLLVLRGDLADLTVTGAAEPAALRALGRLWSRSFASALREAYRKPYRPSVSFGTRRNVEPLQLEAQAATRRALARAGLDEAALQADLTLKRPAVLRTLFPEAPALHDTLALQLDLRADAQTLSTSGTLRSNHLRVGRLRTANVESEFRARASLAAPLLQTLDASFDASADTLAIGRTRFQAPALAASFHDRSGDVQLSTSAGGGNGRLQLGAGLHLLPDRNRLRVRTLRLAAGDYQWQNAGAAPVDLYADAVAVPGLTLVSRSESIRRPQRITLQGVLSDATSDTLFANAQRVRLRSISRVLGLQHAVGGRVGGRLDARLAWTGGPQRPELTGRLDVARLSFDDHRLGRLTAQSRYVPGSPRVAFEARLQPNAQQERGNQTNRAGGAASSMQTEQNRLAAGGTVALPGLGNADTQAGALDLTFDVERADLFFLDYVTNGNVTDAGGNLSGEGRIGGTFQDPLFQADLQINKASFQVPRFGVRYGIDGAVAVSPEGIEIDGAHLTDSEGGSAKIDGSLFFNDYEFLSFDLRAALEDLQIMDVEQSPDLPFLGQIAASGPLRLRGPLSDARLSSSGLLRTTPESELVIPIEEDDESESAESGFLIFADSTGRLPDLRDVTQRQGILDERPAGERTFVDGLDLNLDIAAPQGSTVRLVFDPLLGDEIAAVGSGEIQLRREEGDFSLFGTFNVDDGHYLFTAGQVFQRRFQIEGGTLRWDGPAPNAQLDLTATYRTRASRAGLPGSGGSDGAGRIPIVVRLGVSGRVQQPSVDLSLAVDQAERGFSDYSSAGLETVLNSEDRESGYATSVLLTNTFLLTTDLAERETQGLSETSNRLAFNSVSQLVSSQLNRYLNEALPNLDVNLGVQGENPRDLDVVYGAALRLLDERLVIRGEGVLDDERASEETSGFEGEFVVEVRLTPRVSAEAFYRREGSLLSERALTSTTGAGLSYQTEFSSWRLLWHRLFGWLGADDPGAFPPQESDPVAAGE